MYRLVKDLPTLTILLDAIATGASVGLHDRSGDQIAPVTIVGGDMEENELLIEMMHPCFDAPLEHDGWREYWLVVRHNHQQLRLLTQIKDEQFGLLTFSVAVATLTNNRRWHDRLQFSPHLGPEICVSNDGEKMTGCARNISSAGIAIDFWSKNCHRAYRQSDTVALDITFNPSFTLSCSGELISSRFLRHPSCHTQLRLRLRDVHPLARCQLDSFVASAMHFESVRYITAA